MKKLLVLLVIINFSYTFCQSNNYDYKDGYKYGFSKGCECSSLPPGTNYILHSGSYGEGYNEGLIEGKFYKLKNQASREFESKKRTVYPNYFEQGNLNLLHQDLYNKQRTIDERRLYINYLASEFNYIFVNIPRENLKQNGVELQKISDEFFKRSRKYYTYNLLNSGLFYQIVDDLNYFKNKLYNYY